MRRALSSFLEALGLRSETVEDVVLAVGEVLANAAEHAYGESTGTISLKARVNDGAIEVEVADSGRFVTRDRTEGRGFGLTIVRAIAREVNIDTRSGTRVSMVFGSGCSFGSDSQSLA